MSIRPCRIRIWTRTAGQRMPSIICTAAGSSPDDGGGCFNPGDDMTRGDFMVMIANAFQLTGAGSGSFPDVPDGSRYYDAVAAAKAFDIARATHTGLFHPEWGLTRQDAMVIIVRALKNTGTALTPGSMSDLTGFSDASRSRIMPWPTWAPSSVSASSRAPAASSTRKRRLPAPNPPYC